MGKNKKGRATISAVVDSAVIDLIDSRRERLTLSRSTYLTLIVQYWIKEGSPPVNHAEKAIAELEKIRPSTTPNEPAAVKNGGRKG